MSKIEKLIEELCPNGVEYKKLEFCCRILDNKRKPISKNSRNIGIYPYYGANGIQDYIDNYIFDGKYVLIGEDGSVQTQNGNPIVNWAEGKIWVNNHAHIIEEANNVLLRYLFHYLQIVDVSDLIHGNIPKLTGSDFRNIIVPVPPLEVQEEIVRILDKFGELEAELEARKSQYEFWRDKLLNNNMQKFYIKDICINISSGGTPSTRNPDYYNGNIPWLRTQEINWNSIKDTEIKITNEAVLNSSAKLIPKNCVIIAMYGATVGKSAFNNIPLTTNQACCNLEINSNLANYKYVFYWFLNKYKYIKSLGQGSQTNINSQIIKNLVIELPSLQEQEKIVNILDKFNKLVNDISEGLPAEIEARRKQYEYYRNKLLSFEELVVNE